MFETKKLQVLLTGLLLVGCASRQVVKPQETTTAAAPITAATAIPEVTPTPTPSNPNITMAFVGDIMMGGRAANKLKTEGPDSFFIHTAPLLKKADIVVGNLEGPLGLDPTGKDKKKFNFLIDPIAADGLGRAGFKVLTMANNHTMDFGVEALKSTFAALDKNGLKRAGAGMNEEMARRPAWLDVNGHKVAILAYSLTEPTRFWANAEKPGCAHATPKDIKEDIQKARAEGAQLVFVCIHWGREKQVKLRSYQPYIAHEAIDAGADAVIGHHPHIWQKLEVYHGHPIAYSIGNFAFGSITQQASSGILYLSFDEKNQWTGGKIAPLDVSNYRVDFASRLMTPANAKKFFNYLAETSTNVNLNYGDEEFSWNSSSSK